jgi:RNA polymerase sigma factor (sigma-70 family)
MKAMAGEAARLPVDHLPRVGLGLFGDERLARLAAAGDMRAMAAIFRRHHQELYRYCRAILRDPDEAEDALQATMAKAVSALPGETRDIVLKPWLFRVAHNEAVSILRSRRPSAALDSEEPAPSVDVARQAEDRERLRQLVRDLDRLPVRQRGALVMRELSGLGFDEIGTALGLGPDAAKQAIYEARVSLQEMVAGRDMDCDSVRQAISAGDRRTLRSRRIRAHMRECRRCTDFAAAIDTRRSDLAALAPPIALPTALAALHAALGDGSAGAGSGAAAAGAAGGASIGVGSLGTAVGGTAAVKTAATVIAATAIAGGAAGVTGVVPLGGSSDRSVDRSAESSPPAESPSRDRTSDATAVAPAHAASGGSERAPGDERSHAHRTTEEGAPASHGQHQPEAASPSQGSAGSQASAHSQAPPSPPGQAQSSPGEASSTVSNGQTHGHGEPNTISQSTAHSNPQAQAHSNSQAHSQASTETRGGGSMTAPGQTGVGPHGPKNEAGGTTLGE